MQLENLNLNYWAIAPEIIASLTGVLLMLVDALQKKGARKLNAAVALIGIVLALLSVFRLGESANSAANVSGGYFGGMVVIDPIRIFFSVTILIVAIIATLMASQFVRDEGLPPGEFFTLLLFGTAGMLMLASAGDLVMVFLGLEIASITTYVMAGYRRYDARANESSLKYFLLGSFATAFLLYGMALVYGATGTTNIAAISAAINAGQISYRALLLVGAAMMLVGFGFKIATAPFHMWTPDVYEGAPTIVTGFMSTGPKAAVFAAFLRVFAAGFAGGAPGVGTDLHATWLTALAVIAAITMTAGNVIAISQKNIKRMLAYSSIAHAGYALVGFVTGEYASVAFYMLVYCVMSLGAFAVIQLLARAGDRKTEIADYAGIGFEAPGLTFSLSIFLLSLAGIPPTAGFMSKLFVFKTAWDAPYNLRWLVVVAVVNSIISIYYYLYPIVVMFFRPLAPGFVRPRVSVPAAIALIITLLGTLYLGILPNRVMNKMGSGSGAAQSAQTHVLNR
ncbi:MAG TPA: NADH-quinone oxidoreductase subunit N [Blastocatellia bacterium]|nr:NADH-quinone oxidoreductase subunit N [Blastocatellia bacterium]